MEPPQVLSDERPASSQAVAVSLVALALLAALYIAWPIWRAFLPLEIDVNEPWNAYHADAARTGQPLYPDPDGLVANIYPPLSFYLVGGIAAVTCDAVYVGRLFSVLATAALAWAVGFCVRQLGGARTSALLAALWFIATMARFFDGYVGMNDPHLLALAIMAWALAWFLRRHRSGRAVEPAILAMVFAGFFKHSLLAIPATALCWLALTDRRRALRAAVVGGGAALLGLVLCGAIYGDAFFRQLLMPRHYALLPALASLGRLQWIAPALAVFAVWAGHERQGAAVRFTMVFVTVAFVTNFLQRLGDGIDDNAQFELTIAAAIGLGLAFDRLHAVPAVRQWGLARSRLVLVLILIVRLLASSHMSPYLLIGSPDFRASLWEQAAVMDAETARIAAIPSPTVCFVATPDRSRSGPSTAEEIMWRAIVFAHAKQPGGHLLFTPVMAVSRRAGKPYVCDICAVGQRVKTGRMAQEELNRRIQAQGIRFEPVDPRTMIRRR